MITDLDGAVRQQTEYKRTNITIGFGAHKGYFIGFGPVITETAQCKRCKGKRSINDESCRTCSGTGQKEEKKVAILYQMGSDLFQEEWVNYKVSGPGKLADGSPKSSTTLYSRMKNFSDGLTDEKEIAGWYRALPKDDDGRLLGRIPIEMIVTENDGGNLVIASIRKLQKRQEPQHKPDPDFLDEAFT